MAGLMPTPFPTYAASKTAVVGIGRCFPNPWNGVKVVSLCPSYSDTKMGHKSEQHPIATREVKQAGGLIKPEMVADGMMMLLRREVRSGAAVRVAPSGCKIHRFPSSSFFSSQEALSRL